MKNINPFPLYSYINSKYFFNRTQETERIISAVTNQRNIALFSEGGIGKTTLIKHVASELKELDNYQFYYFPFLQIDDTRNFPEIFLTAVFHKGDTLKKLKRVFPELQFSLKVNKFTGGKFIKIDEKEIDFESVLRKTINYLLSKNKKIVFAFDDIQNVLYVLDKNRLSILQKYLSPTEIFSFIFTADNKNTLLKFLGKETGQTEIMELPKPEKKKYARFIKKRFAKENRKINKEAVNYLLDWTKTNTFYTHYICNKIFHEGYKNITEETIKNIIAGILKEYEYIFLGYKFLLSEYQWKLLKAIATEGEAKGITSAEFITKYKLNAPSSVKTAITALLDKKLVVRKRFTYHLTNIFLEKWLSENPG